MLGIQTIPKPVSTDDWWRMWATIINLECQIPYPRISHVYIGFSVPPGANRGRLARTSSVTYPQAAMNAHVPSTLGFSLYSSFWKCLHAIPSSFHERRVSQSDWPSVVLAILTCQAMFDHLSCISVANFCGDVSRRKDQLPGLRVDVPSSVKM